MDRPTLNSPIVTKKAAEKLLPLIADWSDAGDEKGELLEQIEHAITLNDCGYEIAKFLENNYGFCPDSELVNIFENDTFHFKSNCLKQLTKQWIADNNINQSRQIGDTAFYKGNKGKITSITDDGKYLLNIPSLGHVEKGIGTSGIYVNWEDVSDE